MSARVSHPKTLSTRDLHRCGCVAFKRFAKMSPLVVRARVGSLWCQKCGRLLCEAHRNQHSCEMEMEELERRRRVDVDAIREGIKRQEEEKEQRAADADALKRAEAGAKAARYRMWKDRRRHVAGISSSVASMVQRWSVQAEAGRKRDRLLDIYTSCTVWKSNLRRVRVDLHAIDATPARWRGDVGSTARRFHTGRATASTCGSGTRSRSRRF